MRFREPCELRRDGMKSGWTQINSTSGENFFPFVKNFFHFSLAFRPSCQSTSVFGNIGFYLFWLYFSLFILNYFLKNELNFLQKMNKIVYFLSIFHNFVLIFNKTCGDILDQWHLSRCGRIFNQWLYVTCGRSVSETEFQWRNICKKCTSSREFRVIPYNSL